MKRRVLRAHANKRCLRILSASHQLQTPSTATTADRAYAVLCDASFLRAIVLAYWQAHAPAEWREGRKRLLRKAAAAAAAAAADADASSPLLHGPTAASSRSSVASQGDDASAPEAGNSEGAKEKGRRPKSVRPLLNPIAAVSRLPARLPAHSPVEFLRALMNDAFQGSGSSSNNSSNSAAEAGARQKSRSGGSPSSRRRGGGDDEDDDSDSDGDWDGDADEAEGLAQSGGVGGGQAQSTGDKQSAHHTGNGRGGGGSRDAPNAPQHRANAAVTTRSKQKSLPFVFHCLPETVAALHRMHDSTLHDDDSHSERAHGLKGKAGGDDQQQGTPRRSPSSASTWTNPKKAAPFSHHDTSVAAPQRTQQQSETERWLAASFGALASTTGTMRGQSATGLGASTTSSSFYHGQFNAPSTTTTSANSGGGGGGSAVSPLTFQEVPAAVVSALLSGLSLLQDPSQSAAVTQDSEDSAKGVQDSSNSSNQKKTTDGHSGISKPPTPLTTHRNEAKMMAAFMAFNTACLTYGESSTAAAELASSSGLGRLRLCSMQPFLPTPDTSAVMGHHALKRLRRRQKQQQQHQMNETGVSVTRGIANAHTNAAAAAAVDGSASVSAPSKPYAPRSYFVATQSHDVRRRLPPATALLRLTTNPDALWIEQRGVAYRYDSDDGGAHAAGGTSVNNKSRRLHETPGASAPHGPSSTDDSNRRGKRSRSSDSKNSHSRSGSHARTASATPTVVAAAPQLSRADVAFMKHLGTATHVPLPEKRASAAAPLHGGDGGVQAGGAQTAAGASLAPSSSALTAGKSENAAQSNAAAGQRRRARQKGQNPLSMKKKQKREVFRA